MRRALAATEVLLIAPAMLFMMALMIRQMQPQPLEPAHTAQRIVMWYSATPHVGLWLFLMAMPLAVFVIGAAAFVGMWQTDVSLRQAVIALRAHIAPLVIAMVTCASAGILAFVAIHALSD